MEERVKATIVGINRGGRATLRKFGRLASQLVNLNFSFHCSLVHRMVANKEPENFAEERDFAKELDDLLQELSRDEGSEEIISEINGTSCQWSLVIVISC